MTASVWLVLVVTHLLAVCVGAAGGFLAAALLRGDEPDLWGGGPG